MLPKEHLQISAMHTELGQVRNLLHDIRQLFAAGSQHPANLLARIDELAAQVFEHLLDEERGGYFAELIEVAPHLRERAQILLGQHTDLRSALVQLHRCTIAAELAFDEWSELEAEFVHFAQQFCDHETAENDLLQQAYCRDIGAED